MLKPLVGAAVLVFAVAQAHAQRIEHVGPVSGGEVAPTQVEMRADLLTSARMIFPPAWNGFAQKGLDTRRASAVRIQSGEPWLAALDRWLAQERLTARLDWNARNFYLRPAADIQPAPYLSYQAPPQQNYQQPAPYYPPNSQQPAAYYPPAQQQQPYVYQAPQQMGHPGSVGQPQYGGPPARNWAILTSDIRLETTLERWAREGGYRLIWDADKHILISAADQFTGTLPDAINRVLNSPAIRDSDYPLEAVFYANTPPVIRITRLGDQSSVKE